MASSQPIAPQTLSTQVQFQGGQPLPVLVGTDTRVNATADAAGTGAAAVPAGGNVIIIRAVAAIAIRFGSASVGAAAVDANSILFVAGEAPYVLRPGETHFRVIRVGSADVQVQLESAGTISVANA